MSADTDHEQVFGAMAGWAQCPTCNARLRPNARRKSPYCTACANGNALCHACGDGRTVRNIAWAEARPVVKKLPDNQAYLMTICKRCAKKYRISTYADATGRLPRFNYDVLFLFDSSTIIIDHDGVDYEMGATVAAAKKSRKPLRVTPKKKKV